MQSVSGRVHITFFSQHTPRAYPRHPQTPKWKEFLPVGWGSVMVCSKEKWNDQILEKSSRLAVCFISYPPPLVTCSFLPIRNRSQSLSWAPQVSLCWICQSWSSLKARPVAEGVRQEGNKNPTTILAMTRLGKPPPNPKKACVSKKAWQYFWTVFGANYPIIPKPEFHQHWQIPETSNNPLP